MRSSISGYYLRYLLAILNRNTSSKLIETNMYKTSYIGIDMLITYYFLNKIKYTNDKYIDYTNT
jgi:hypothetical protein